jgi:riboflavin biosynthesis pyrimidine reductase
VDAIARELYGHVDLAARAGVVHVTAVWEPPEGGALVTLAIGPDTPRSEHDAFVLSLARARADAIVTTGKMLRDEPHTRYDLSGPADALAAWRRERAGCDVPPWLLVLTSGRDVPLDHPALHGAPRPIVYTTRQSAAALAPAVAGTRIEVVGVDSPSARSAIDHLRAGRGAKLVSIEAGPTTSRALYDDPVAVDELMLSVYAAPELDRRVRGKPLLSHAELAARLPHATEPVEVSEPSGPWRFQLRALSSFTPSLS